LFKKPAKCRISTGYPHAIRERVGRWRFYWMFYLLFSFYYLFYSKGTLTAVTIALTYPINSISTHVK